MRLHFDNEWLKKMIEDDEDLETCVGNFETSMKIIHELVKYEQKEPEDED
jgi:hypothetical protein